MTHGEEIGIQILKDKIKSLEESVCAKNQRIVELEAFVKEYRKTIKTSSRVGRSFKIN